MPGQREGHFKKGGRGRAPCKVTSWADTWVMGLQAAHLWHKGPATRGWLEGLRYKGWDSGATAGKAGGRRMTRFWELPGAAAWGLEATWKIDPTPRRAAGAPSASEPPCGRRTLEREEGTSQHVTAQRHGVRHTWSS